MAFLKDFFEKVDYEKNQQTPKSMQNYSVGMYTLLSMTTVGPNQTSFCVVYDIDYACYTFS